MAACLREGLTSYEHPWPRDERSGHAFLEREGRAAAVADGCEAAGEDFVDYIGLAEQGDVVLEIEERS